MVQPVQLLPVQLLQLNYFDDPCESSFTNRVRIWEQRLYALTEVLFLCLFPVMRSNEENKHRNNIQVSI